MDQQVFGFKTAVLPLVFACFALSVTAQAAAPARVYPGYSTAAGDQALQSFTSGVWNTALGARALFHDTTGACNVATGNAALLQNTTGTDNAANGVYALRDNTTGSRNTALGYCAGINLTTGNNNIDISNAGVAGESGTIRIGNSAEHAKTFIAGIRGVATANNNAIPVVIDSDGQLGTTSSSRRFKEAIKPMDQASEAVLALRPVTFNYKSDKTATPQFGLIAEEVAEVNPDLVVRDDKGEIYSVRYNAVNAMLLNEFLKEHRKVNEQGVTIAELRTTIARQESKIAALATKLDNELAKVNAKLELSRPRPKVTVSSR